MQETAIMNIETRTNTSKGANRLLRQNGYLPANISGKGMDSIAIAVKKEAFRRMIKEYGRNAVIKLVTQDDTSYTVMTKEVSIAPVINEISHLDFQVVSLTEEMKQEVPIKVIGSEFLEAKRLLLNTHMDVILVNGLPHDIPHEIEIDVSNLKSGDSIAFKDLVLPEGITFEYDLEQRIVSVKGARAQEVTVAE